MRDGKQLAAVIRRARPMWVVRADTACARLNGLMLGVAMLLAIVTVSGQRNPQVFAAIVAHLDWMAPPMDSATGLIREQSIVPIADP